MGISQKDGNLHYNPRSNAYFLKLWLSSVKTKFLYISGYVFAQNNFCFCQCISLNAQTCDRITI